MPQKQGSNPLSRVGSKRGPKTGWNRPNIVLRHGNRAVVFYDNEEFYLGTWDGIGLPSDEILEKFKRLCIHLEKQFDAKQAGVVVPESSEQVTVDEAIALYLRHLKNDEDGDLRPDGSLCSHYERAIGHLKPISALYGHVPANEFTAKALKDYRTAVRAKNPTWHEGLPSYQPNANGKTKRPPKQWSIFSANCAVQNVVRFYAWLESESLVPKGQTEHLSTVGPLREADKYEAVTVPDESLLAVLGMVSPQIGAILKLEYITAARSGEVCRMRACDIDASEPIWIYTPRDDRGKLKHKNSWRGHNRSIPLGPEAQAILAPFLAGRPDNAYLFVPAESKAWYAEQRLKTCGRQRKTPVWPSELRQRYKRKAARKATAKRRINRPFFDSRTIRKAVVAALERIRAAGDHATKWTPKNLRHTRITQIQRECGWESAQAVAGHKSLQATAKYAHEQHLRACQIAGAAQVFSTQFGVAESLENTQEAREAS